MDDTSEVVIDTVLLALELSIVAVCACTFFELEDVSEIAGGDIIEDDASLEIVLLVDTVIAAAELDTGDMTTEVLSVRDMVALVGTACGIDVMSVVVVFLKTLRDVLIVELVDVDMSDDSALDVGCSVKVSGTDDASVVIPIVMITVGGPVAVPLGVYIVVNV